jgi:hypothetical protein
MNGSAPGRLPQSIAPRMSTEQQALIWFDEGVDEEPPEGIDDEDLYAVVPEKRGSHLGRSLVMRFVRERLPEQVDVVEDIFRKRGAYPSSSRCSASSAASTSGINTKRPKWNPPFASGAREMALNSLVKPAARAANPSFRQTPSAPLKSNVRPLSKT